jgi:glycosyltransferase involved in cell wall biosynthesis
MKIAVVHDYFTQLGGAEKVAEELIRILPGAALHTTVALPDRMPPGLVNVPVKTSWMQKMPGMREYYRLYFLLYPLALPSLDLSGYDLVISSSSGYAKGVHTNRDALHVCYCHTPMRWAWSFDSYSAREEMGAAKRLLLPHLINVLRRWDVGASRQPDHFIANSRVVAERIQQAYGRIAEVIHPPIDLARFCPSPEQDDYYIVLSRLVSYKRIDLAIQACTLLGRRLLVIGDGPDRARLTAKAGPTTSFLGRLSDAEVEHHAARCRALIFPGEEDFGMAPLEVAAAGRPTIAYRGGGAMETIIDGVTGTFFDRQDPESLATAIACSESVEWSSAALRRHAEKFGIDVFQAKLRVFLAKVGAPLPDAPVLPSNAAPRAAAGSVGIVPVREGIPA